MVGGLNIVQWGTDKSGKSVQVGLSPGQTRGSVSGVIVTRPASQDVNTVYSPGVGSTSIKIDREGNATTVKKDQYGNVIEVTQRSSSGVLSFQRKTALYGSSVESGLPGEVAKTVQDIQTQQENLAQYRKAAEYAKAQELQQQQARQQPTPSFQLPGFSDLYQNRYVKPPKEKEYYAVQHPSGFGKVQLYSEYKPTDRFKLFGVIPAGSPEPGGLYKSDILGFTKRVGSINQTEARAIAAKPHKTTSVLDLKLNQAGNMLLFSPFAFGSMPAIKMPKVKLSAPKVKLPSLFSRSPPKTPAYTYLSPEVKAQVLRSEVVKSIQKPTVSIFSRSPPKTPAFSYLSTETQTQIRQTELIKSIRDYSKYSMFSRSPPKTPAFSYLPKATQENIMKAEIQALYGIKPKKPLSIKPPETYLRLNNNLLVGRQIVPQQVKIKPTYEPMYDYLESWKPEFSIPKTNLNTRYAAMSISAVGILLSNRTPTQIKARTREVTILKDLTRIMDLSRIMDKIDTQVRLGTSEIVVPSLRNAERQLEQQKQSTKQRTSERTPQRPKASNKTIIPRIPKVPIIKIPSLELPEFTHGTSSSKKKGLKYKKIKTKMLTLKDLLGK